MSIPPNYKPKKIAFLHTHLHTHLHTQYKKSDVFYHFAGSGMRGVIGVVTTHIRRLLYTRPTNKNALFLGLWGGFWV